MFEVIEIYTWDDVSRIKIAECELKADAEEICKVMNASRVVPEGLPVSPYHYVVCDSATNGFSIPRMMAHISEEICSDFCKHNDSCIGYFKCDFTENGGVCPLVKLNF